LHLFCEYFPIFNDISTERHKRQIDNYNSHQAEEIVPRILNNSGRQPLRNSYKSQFQYSTPNFPKRSHASKTQDLQQLPAYSKERRMRFPSSHNDDKPNVPLYTMQIHGNSFSNRKRTPATDSFHNHKTAIGQEIGKYPQISAHRYIASLAAAAAVAQQASSSFPYPYEKPPVHFHHHGNIIQNSNFPKPISIPHKKSHQYESNLNRFQNFKDYDDLVKVKHPKPVLLPNEFKRGYGSAAGGLSPLSLNNYKHKSEAFPFPSHGYLIYNSVKGPPFHFIPAPKPDVENFHAQYFNHYDNRLIGKQL
jgi:hypothetical protein